MNDQTRKTIHRAASGRVASYGGALAYYVVNRELKMTHSSTKAFNTMILWFNKEEKVIHKMTKGIHKMIKGFPKMVLGHPKMAKGIPKMVLGHPKETKGIHKIIKGFPKMASGHPKMASWFNTGIKFICNQPKSIYY